jgi:hypothetical protein
MAKSLLRMLSVEELLIVSPHSLITLSNALAVLHCLVERNQI